MVEDEGDLLIEAPLLISLSSAHASKSSHDDHEDSEDVKENFEGLAEAGGVLGEKLSLFVLQIVTWHQVIDPV